MALACCMLRCASDLIHTALVESSNAKRIENGHPFFSEAAANGKGASHVAVEEKSSGIEVQITRAHNLDKADKEYKGRHYTKARQAALGEEVRQRIASVRQKKVQNVSENDGVRQKKEQIDGSNPSQSVGFHEEDCKLDVGADIDDDCHRGNAVVDHRKEHVAAKTFAASSTGKDSSQSNVPENVRNSKLASSSLSALSPKTGISVPESSEMSWGHSYSYRELEKATGFFSDANVLGSGDHAIVYRGVVSNGTHIVLKKLLNSRGQAEKDFKTEVAAIGRIRHKNLVQLIGFCTEGTHRILVYEHIDNGNLEQWLHGPVGKSSPLSWDMRMKTIIGAAKGLAYLHEGLEPKVVHRDVKPSSILLDKQWNAKVSDFGFAKLVGTGKSHSTTRVMGTFGYVAPEYVSTGMLTEKSDIYSYGVLVMETITGRVPVDRNRTAGEVHLVDWVKSLVGSHRSEEVADPNMGVKTSTRSLKRALLVALRCVDPDASKRPKMSHVVHMLESADDNPFCKEPKIAEFCSQRKSKQLATVVQRHKLFPIPAFMLSQNVVDKSGQDIPNDNWPLFGDGSFVGRINRKASWKYER